MYDMTHVHAVVGDLDMVCAMMANVHATWPRQGLYTTTSDDKTLYVPSVSRDMSRTVEVSVKISEGRGIERKFYGAATDTDYSIDIA